MDSNKIKEAFWTALPKLMQKVDVKQVDLAKALGLSKSTISCWFHRKSFPEMDNIQKIADVLGCTTDDLLGREACEYDADFGKLLIASYYAADEGTRNAVRKLLDINGGRS